jgi:hypothetical protein
LKRRNKISKLSQDILSTSRVIAKGKRIRNYKFLVEKYGGTASKWIKKSSVPFKIAGELFEYHWYEHHGIGQFEIKQKKVKE